MEDTYRHKGMRKKLVDTIRAKGITDKNVLSAIEKLPRHFFIENSAFLESAAYEDKAFPIGEGQTISQPYTVAYQSQLLEVQKGDKILEIGTGSGYQACVLAEMGANIYSIERQKKLHDSTRLLLSKLGYKNIKLFFGDGCEGLPNYAPFDKIIVTAAAPEVPQALLEQLSSSGIMVIPVGETMQNMLRVTKDNEGNFQKEELDTFKFVPLLPGKVQ